ncbi:MAG: tetratricopeptide repeat protein [Flavobacteriaceae bacterium]|nr:tetratricopeptide repeat protein [Flavobacteriaceae bacterium]
MKNLLIIFFLCHPLFIISQNNKIDSLENSIINSSNDSVIMMTYNKLRRATINTDPDKSSYYNTKYVDIAIKRKDSFREALGYFYMGSLNIAKSDYEGALKAYFKAANYFELKKDSMRLSSVLNGIGAAYINSGNDSLSLKYFKKAQKISESLGDTRRSAIALNNISEIYTNRKDYNQAKKYLEQSYKEILKTDKVQYKILIATNLGDINVKLGNYKKAINIYNKTLYKIDTIKDTYNHALILKSYGNYYKAIQNNELALKYLNQSYEIFKTSNYFDEAYKMMPDLINSHEQNKEYRSGIELFSEYNAIKDSIFTIEKDKNLTNSLTKYETLKKDAQLRVYKLENEKAHQQKQLYLNLALSGVFIALLVGYFLYINKKKKQQINKALNEKEILLKEVHHRVKNNLQVISSLLEIQQRNITNRETKQLFQESINRVRTMSLIHQNLYQKNNIGLIDIETYLQDLVINLVKNYNVEETEIKIETHIENIELDLDKVISVGLIINELISNILKYAFINKEEGIININLVTDTTNIKIQVEDNGVGLPKDFSIGQSKSLGYKLVKAFTQKLMGELEVENLDEGCRITVTIPKQLI